jgi:hypothetical protein
MGVGRNLSYKKRVMDQSQLIAKFGPVIGGDDDLLVNQFSNGKNTKASLGLGSITISSPKKTWKEWFRQKTRHLGVGVKYKLKHRVFLAVIYLSQILFWFSFINLAVLAEELYVLCGGFVFRSLTLIVTFGIAGKKIGSKFNPGAVLVLDFLFSVYYPITALIAFLSKRTSWN